MATSVALGDSTNRDYRSCVVGKEFKATSEKRFVRSHTSLCACSDQLGCTWTEGGQRKIIVIRRHRAYFNAVTLPEEDPDHGSGLIGCETRDAVLNCQKNPSQHFEALVSEGD